MKPITICLRWHEKNQQFEHNHIVDGHLAEDYPPAVSVDQQQAWSKAKWKLIHGFLDEGNNVSVIKDLA